MRNTNRKCVWMLVTFDKYELPVAVFDRAEQLAEFAGTTLNNIYSQVSSVEAGRCKRSKYHRVFIDD